MTAAALENAFAETALAPALPRLQAALADGSAGPRHGDADTWEAALAALPDVQPASMDCSTGVVRAGGAGELDAAAQSRLHAALQALLPWRKGPFELFGERIDTEWRSDWKWERIAGHVAPLDQRLVLDVGCGNGYHGFRMHGAGAGAVLGIDPTPLFHYQFRAVQRYLRIATVVHLPLPLEALPADLQAFDTVFSMGVLYHRRSPLDHLRALHGCLRPGGELVLETLVVEGGPDTVLVPEDRYARMRNVWFIPSCALAQRWLRRCGFDDVRVLDVSPTTVEEQRSTVWMPYESLAAALDPADPARTVEGHSAPLRAAFSAVRR